MALKFKLLGVISINYRVFVEEFTWPYAEGSSRHAQVNWENTQSVKRNSTILEHSLKLTEIQCINIIFIDTDNLYITPCKTYLKTKGCLFQKIEKCSEIRESTALPLTLVYRLPYTDSVWGIFPGPATTQKVQLAGLQSLTVLSMLIRGITITLTRDWHGGRLATLSPSITLHTSLLTEGKIWHISVLWMWGLTKIIFQLLHTDLQLLNT